MLVVKDDPSSPQVGTPTLGLVHQDMCSTSELNVGLRWSSGTVEPAVDEYIHSDTDT